MTVRIFKHRIGRFRLAFKVLLFVILWVLMVQSTSIAQHAKLLPQATVAVVSARKPTGDLNTWKKTGIYQLWHREALARFFTELRDKSLSQNNSGALISKLNPDELWALVEGNMTCALIQRSESLQGLIIADIGQNADKTKQWLTKLEEKIESDSVVRRANDSMGVSVVNFRLITPEPKSFKSLSYAIKDKLLVIATDETDIPGVFDRTASDSPGKLLMDDPSFVDSTSKVRSEYPRSTLWWFVRPLELGRLASANKSSGRIGPTAFFEFASKEGFDAIKAVGGVASLNTEGTIAVVANVIAKRPLRRSMRLLGFDNNSELKLPKWVSTEFSNSAMAAVGFDDLLENFSSLFDELYGEGEEGVFESVLSDIQNDPQGPQVDLQTEIFVKATGPLLVVTLQKQGTESAKVFAVPVKDVDSVTVAIARLYNGDPQAEKIDDPSMDGWLVKPIEDDPATTTNRKDYVVAIRNGYVLLATSVADIEHCFESNSNSLASDPEYLSFLEWVRKELGDERCFSFISRFDHLAQRKLMEIKAGQPTGAIGFAFEMLGWRGVLQQMDRGSLPEFRELQEFCQGNLAGAGKATAYGWRVVMELTSHEQTK